MRVILTTVGTSLRTNAIRSRKSQGEINETDLKQYLEKASPQEASAETNSLYRIDAKRDRVILFHTDTPACKQCADVLRDGIVQTGLCKFADVRKIDLKSDEKHLATHGLRNLVDVLIKEIRQARNAGHEPIINATGGFKAEIAYTTMVGMVFGVPVIYIYEDFKEVVTLPSIPLEWDTSLFLEYEDFFVWLDSEPRSRHEVEGRLKAIPDAVKLKTFVTSIDDSEDCLYLNGIGDLLYSRFRQEREQAQAVDFPERSDVRPDDKVHLSQHNYSRGIVGCAERIANNPYVTAVISGEFADVAQSKIQKVNDSGQIVIIYGDGNKGCRLIVQTTARGKLQTLKVADELTKLL